MSVVHIRDGQLFKDVKYFVNDSVGRERQQELESLLMDNGATATGSPSSTGAVDVKDGDDYAKSSRFDLTKCTHVITNSINFPEAAMVKRWNEEQAEDTQKIIVTTPDWVIRSTTIGLQDPLVYTPDPAKIFSGVFLQCSADLPKGDREALYGLVTALGGQQRESITKDTTHIACLTKHEATYELIKETGLGIKFILPHWFDACITMQQRVDDKPFLFTEELPAMLRPETWGSDVLYERQEATRLKRNVVGITIPAEEKSAMFSTAVKAHDDVEFDSDPAAVQRVLVFQGKKLLLASQLGLSKSLKKSLETWIGLAGGQIVEDDKELLECDIFITPHRDGVPYLLAVKHNKTVATLSWFYHVLKIGKLTSPMDQLLHYPTPSTPVPQFSEFSISVTNYTGEAREYLKRLISAMGAKFTTTFASTNTHLVAASKYGDKVAKCRIWHVPCVNHKWLEACFQEWRDADVSREEYSTFPPGINFMTLLGETGLNDGLLKKWTDKAAKLGEVDVETMLTQGEAADLGDVEKDVLDEDRKDVGEGPSKQPQAVAPAPKAKSAARKAKAAPATPLKVTAPIGANTNDTPVSSKRSAATVAAQRLHDIAPDMLKWEKEKKLKPNSKRARMDEYELEPPGSKSPEKRRASVEPASKRARKTATPAEEEEDEPEEQMKKSLSILGDAKVKILVTGVVLSTADMAVQRLHNVSFTEAADDCTHLITMSIKRTEKFLVAMAHAPIIVRPDWLSASSAAGHLLEETPYLLQDPDTEKQLGFKLEEALERAEKAQGRLFAGHTFLRTANVETDLKILSRIVQAHGGKVVNFTSRALESATGEKHVISVEKDKSLWPQFRKLAINIYSRELILRSILTMELQLDEHRF